MMSLAWASTDAYSSYMLARARLESALCWLMASTYRSKPRCRAHAAALSETVVSLSMVAHSWRHRRL
jgi:hypothetical protein